MKSGRIQRRAVLLVFLGLRIRPVNFLSRGIVRVLARLFPRYFPGKFPVVGEIVVDVPNSTPLIFVSDGRDSIASRLFWDGLEGHEPETIKTYLTLLEGSKVVLDVGASTGLFSLLAAAGCAERQIHAFEPAPETFQYLTENLKKNGFSNITPVCGCLLDFDGETPLYLNHSAALPFSTSSIAGYRDAKLTVTAPVMKIDTYAESNGLPALDLIKIDVEGNDHLVLKGAKDILERDQPVIICEVLHEDTDRLLNDVLEGSGYLYFMITDDGLVQQETILGDNTYKYRNFLFLPRSKSERVLQDLALTGASQVA